MRIIITDGKDSGVFTGSIVNSRMKEGCGGLGCPWPFPIDAVFCSEKV